MGSLNATKNDAVSAHILESLSDTPFACSSLERIPSGTTNYVFRGFLQQPYWHNDTAASLDSVIIKHSKHHVPGNEDFLISESRALIEEAMLAGLEKFSTLPTDDGIDVQVPRLLHVDRQTNIRVFLEHVKAIDLSVLLKTEADKRLDRSTAKLIGHALGSWLRSFHSWMSDMAQQDLRACIGENKPMRQLKFRITYEAFIPVLENFPAILEDARTTLETVKAMALEEFSQVPDTVEQEWGIIHGDFWTGNVLMPNLSKSHELKVSSPLHVLDWEFAQLGHRSIDLGQMIGDLIERKHFLGSTSAPWIMEGFTDGYGPMSEDMAFRTIIHAGVHLICWYTRGPPGFQSRHPVAKVEEAMKLGVGLVLRGWARDRRWFETSQFACLFKASP